MIHYQSPVGFAVVTRNGEEILIPAVRHAHYALGVECPVCQARGGGSCIAQGKRFTALEVHAERAEAAL